MNRKLNGYLMSKDIPVAQIINNQIIPLQLALMPLYFQRNGDLFLWLESRAIDAHRPNSRLLKKALRLAETDDISTVLTVYGATVTDTYWVKPENMMLQYDDIRFCDNYFDTLALKGDIISFNEAVSNRGKSNKTPELTNIGSYEKSWKIQDGRWWLYKSGNEQELFSEIFIAKLGHILGYSMAYYEKDGQFIKSLDFTKGAKLNYEPAASLVGDNETYTFNYKEISKISVDLAEDYVNILIMDTLCFNMDRHTMNYGFLREPETGKFVSMAPNFDNNIAFIARGYDNSLCGCKDLLFTLFAEFVAENHIIYNIPYVEKKTIEQIIDEIGIDVDRNYICEVVMHRAKALKTLQKMIVKEQNAVLEGNKENDWER